MRWLAIAVLLAGCDSLFRIDSIPDPGDAQGSGDAPTIDAPSIDAMTCVGTGLLNRCVPSTTTVLTYSVDTPLDTDDMACRVGNLCIVVAGTINVNAHLRATGSRPLVLLATQRLNVGTTGIVDVSSDANQIGAGANDQSCAVPAMGSNQAGTGAAAGGGAGGSFGGTGGDGGSGDAKNNAAAAAAVTSLTTIRGGCAGGQGGLDRDGLHGGSGGSSGGAVYLMAGTAIVVDGKVLAYGSGGFGGGGGGLLGSEFAGGGGGGSGGLIGLDSKDIHVTMFALLLATGGGGGAGENGTIGGGRGFEPDVMFPANRAKGGAASGGAGGGGQGGAGSGGPDGLSGGNTNINGGGGGGGGGTGFVRIFPPTTTQGQVVPPAG